MIFQARKDAMSPVMREKEVWEVRWDNTYPTTTYDEAMGKYVQSTGHF